MAQIRNSKHKSGGRPAGARTRYAGIERFAKHYGCSAHFARQVLDGRAASAPLRTAWARWQAARREA